LPSEGWDDFRELKVREPHKEETLSFAKQSEGLVGKGVALRELIRGGNRGGRLAFLRFGEGELTWFEIRPEKGGRSGVQRKNP